MCLLLCLLKKLICTISSITRRKREKCVKAIATVKAYSTVESHSLISSIWRGFIATKWRSGIFLQGATSIQSCNQVTQCNFPARRNQSFQIRNQVTQLYLSSKEQQLSKAVDDEDIRRYCCTSNSFISFAIPNFYLY